MSAIDAVVVGAGPNGLAAAVTLARQGLRVHVIEANAHVGGGARTAELTEPGFRHDLGSAVHPLGIGSPLFRTLPLEQHGLRWLHPEVPLAHPLDDGRAAVLYRSLEATAEALGVDAAAYRQLFGPLEQHWQALADEVLQPLLHLPRHPVLLASFGVKALQPAHSFAERWFATEAGRALFAGLAAHSTLALEQWTSAAIGLVLGMMGHAVGWPSPAGGAQAISDALASYLRSLGGTIETGRRVQSLDEVQGARAVLLDVTPHQLLRLAGGRWPTWYRRRLEHFDYGPAVFKIDYALDAPIPWTNAACRRAGTIHVGGTLDEIAVSERAAVRGRHAERPYLLVAQPTLFDATRAPEGKHTAWVYAHVPHRSRVDMTSRIEAQLERFAPGFRDVVRTRYVSSPTELERQNANLVGGSINGGANDLLHLLARPVPTPTPYRTPLPGVYLCSSSTPPGGGVHGMCGYHAATLALRDLF
ncbi:MAG: FAD-dependent oxidoreductase [Bacteroidetes bacterium]|jgi:phytoene dehydrogenase-like protein|nr:FAD-dependent oxidoreductase [Bacteroidota bacterium]